MHSGVNGFVTYWQQRLYPGDAAPHHGAVGPLKKWERITRIDGVLMLILLALCLAGPWLLAGRARSGMTLFGASALVLLFFPLFTKGYDYRFVIQAFAPLLAAAALAAWGLAGRVAAGPRAARLLGRGRAGSAQPPTSPRR